MNLKKIINQTEEKIRLNRLNEAQQILLKVFKRNVTDLQILNKLAYVSFKLNDIKQAKATLEKIVIISSDTNAKKNLLRIYIQEEDWINSKKIILELFDQEQKNNELRKLLAYTEGKLGNFQNAKNIYDELLINDIYDKELFINYGFLLNKQEIYDDAIAIYKKGLEKYSTDFNLLYNLGVTYKNIFSYKDSIDCFKKAIEVNDTNYQLWLTLAGSYIELKMMDKAKQAIEKAANINKNNPEIFQQLAIFSQREGDNNKAITNLKIALEIDPDHIESNYQLGLMYLKLNRFKEATKYYKFRVDKINRYVLDKNVSLLNSSDDLIAIWEQGIGDSLIYMRLSDAILKKVKSLSIVVQDKLYDYMNFQYPEIKFYKDNDFENLKAKNYFANYKKINLGTFLRFINTPNNESFNHKKHIFNEFEEKNYKKILDSKHKKIIGLSWKSSNQQLKDEKSFSLLGLDKLYENEDYNFVNLQYGDVSDDISEIKIKYGKSIYVDQELNYYDNLIQLSNLIASCDIVITCSNITAHLAGALHKETLLLLPKQIGELWYWYGDDKESSWYPTIRILRQETSGDWESAIKKIKHYL